MVALAGVTARNPGGVAICEGKKRLRFNCSVLGGEINIVGQQSLLFGLVGRVES